MNNHFNWDDINVGNYKLDHSQNYFASKTLQTPKIKSNMNKQDMNVLKIKLENITICEIDENKEKNKGEIAIENEIINDDNEEKENKVKDDVEPHKIGFNLCKDWSIREEPKPRNGAVSKGKSAPNAYQFLTFYQTKKEQLIRKRDEEERKMREFTSRPVPQFYSHPLPPPKQKVHQLTHPKTPLVLKRSGVSEERKQKKIEQLKKNDDLGAFKSRPPLVLKEKPFIPNKLAHDPPKVCPFNLQSDRRAQERKKFNTEKHKALEIKLKKQGGNTSPIQMP